MNMISVLGIQLKRIFRSRKDTVKHGYSEHGFSVESEKVRYSSPPTRPPLFHYVYIEICKQRRNYSVRLEFTTTVFCCTYNEPRYKVYVYIYVN